MKGIIELISINDISNIIESKLCGQNLNYYIKNQDVEENGEVYKMIVKMDIKCTPQKIYYTKSMDVEIMESEAVVIKGHKDSRESTFSYANDIKNKNAVKNQLKSNIHNICAKLI